jgi:SMC interacting uncharacterized protein involved in chromosome segregation
MKLFEISTQYQSLMNDIAECDELTTEQLQAIESVDDSLQEKAKAVGAFIKNLEADYFAIHEAIKTMEDRARKVNAKIENLKEYLKCNLEKCDIKEIKSPYFDIRIKLNPASVIVNDENLIPEQYLKEKLYRFVDKAMIAKELKNNVLIPGVMLERRTRIEIR